MTTNNPTADRPFWSLPVRYTVSTDGGAKLYATCGGNTRTVTTLRTATDKDAAAAIANDLTRLVHLADLGLGVIDTLPHLVDQLADAFGVDGAMFANLDAEADPAVGVVLSLSKVLDLPTPDSQTKVVPGHYRADPLLRLLTATAAEPEATRRALISEIRTILEQLDGTIVMAEYEYSGWYNVAPWIDTLNLEQLKLLLLDDTYETDALCCGLLGDWSNPGGLLEDYAARIEHDSDFRLLVTQADVVRRLASTRPELLAAIYTPEVIDVMRDDADELREAADVAAALLTRASV